MLTRRNFLKTMAIGGTGLAAMGLVGCTSSDSQTSESSESSSTAESSSSESGSSESSSAESGEKETLVIAIQTYSEITDYDDNYLTKMLAEELGINIEFYLLSADATEAATQLSLMVSAGQELPDVICTMGALSDETILEYGSKGVFVDLTEYMSDPEVTPYFNAIESEDDKEAMLRDATSADGNIYTMVQYAPQVWNMTPYRMYINQTWLDNLGLPMPTTIDEYYETLKAFAEQDPNGNGLQDEIALYGFSAGTYGENVTIPIMNWFVYYPTNKISNVELTLDDTGTQVIAPFTQDGWREGLEYMHKLCSEGLMPESVFTDDKTQFMSVLNNEEVNLVGSLATGSLSRWNDFDNNANGQEYEMLPVMENPNGTAYAVYLEFESTSIWHVTSSCKNPELAVRLGDLFYRSDISITARYGAEDVDWTRDEAVLSDPNYSNAYIEAGLADSATVAVYNDIWGTNNNTIWRDVNPRYLSIEDSFGVVNAEDYDPTIKSVYFYADSYDYYFDRHPEHLLPALNYTTEEATEQAETITNLSTYIGQSMAQFITGARALTDAEWENYKKDLDDMGLETWLENAQAAFERQQ